MFGTPKFDGCAVFFDILGTVFACNKVGSIFVRKLSAGVRVRRGTSEESKNRKNNS